MNPQHPSEPFGVSAKIVSKFLQGPLPVFIIAIALLAGVAALLLTPREEEPQIVVPLADVYISAPGLSAVQVERQISTPLEKLLYQIDGVEYVYSMSREGRSVVTVRFHVGEDREESLIKLYDKIHSNEDLIPPSVEGWIVKPVEIDDVPIVVATLWSEDSDRVSDHELRRLAEEVELFLQHTENTNKVNVVGGRPRTIRVELKSNALAARKTTPLEVADALRIHNVELPAGSIEQQDEVFVLKAGRFIRDASDVRDLVINVVDGNPVYLKDVATIIDGPAETENYTWIGFGPAAQGEQGEAGEFYPAVSVSVAKKKGTNAVWVAEDVKERMDELADRLFPPEVNYTITRNYGVTADEKVNELVKSLGVAVLSVVIFIGLVLGWRSALIIALAVPVCYGLALMVNLLAGYTINRVTLFALILALGLLVDDPITDIENIERFFRMRRFKPRRAILLAVQEVYPALIMSTIAVVLSFVPMFFITGMMGPYMAPMALNVPVTILISTIVAFCVTPFLARVFLQYKPAERTRQAREAGGENVEEYDVRRTPLYRFYGFLLRPLLQHRWRAWAFLVVIVVAFFAAVALPAFRLVPLKMLPFDNKNEFQIVVDMPEGTTLERTEGITRRLADYLRTVPEVTDFTGFVGLASPMDFNGMVRQYYMRKGPHVADIRVNLVHKDSRSQKSHGLLLRIREDLEAIADREGANIKLVEIPPGPPVVATVTAEIHGDPATPYDQFMVAVDKTARRLRAEPLVVDVDTSVEADQTQLVFQTDKEKAALSGVGTREIAQTVALAVGGLDATMLNIPTEANPLPIRLRMPLEWRSSPERLATLYIKGRPGIVKVQRGAGLENAPRPLVQLGEIGDFRSRPVDKTIYHKNLRRIAYVFADTAGRPPADVVLDVGADLVGPGESRDAVTASDPTPETWKDRTYLSVGGGRPWSLPPGTSVRWTGEGEWKITLEVFRDLGIAFGAALIGILLVLVIQTGSTVLSLIMMTAIPLTMIGIMPGFWLLNSIGTREVAGLPNPVFFTATAMIGMIALAGIVVRNSVVLIDFVHGSLREGMDLQEALVQSGAIRMRPIVLTAGTTLLGNIVITLDPIFSGLAWAIIFGVAASTIFTLGVIPVVYYLVYDKRPGQGLPARKIEDD